MKRSFYVLAAATLPQLFEFPSDMARVAMPANHLNDQVLVRTPGGGGYGPSSERDPKLVRRDRELGYVPQRAPSRRPRPG